MTDPDVVPAEDVLARAGEGYDFEAALAEAREALVQLARAHEPTIVPLIDVRWNRRFRRRLADAWYLGEQHAEVARTYRQVIETRLRQEGEAAPPRTVDRLMRMLVGGTWTEPVALVRLSHRLWPLVSRRERAETYAHELAHLIVEHDCARALGPYWDWVLECLRTPPYLPRGEPPPHPERPDAHGAEWRAAVSRLGHPNARETHLVGADISFCLSCGRGAVSGEGLTRVAQRQTAWAMAYATGDLSPATARALGMPGVEDDGSVDAVIHERCPGPYGNAEEVHGLARVIVSLPHVLCHPARHAAAEALHAAGMSALLAALRLREPGGLS